MKLQIENTLRELGKWDRKKNKTIDKDNKKRLQMVEDFVLNLYTRTCDVFKFCETSNQGFVYVLPSIHEKDQHSEAYQKTLLCLEGLYQFAEYTRSKSVQDDSKTQEISAYKQELSTIQDQLKLALNEKEAVKKQCRDIIKQTQMVHEKCKLKKLHYKEVLRENQHLSARNKVIENELKDRESRLQALTAKLDVSKKYIEKTQKDLKLFKDKVHRMTIEINLLEKINIEQAIFDEDGKEKLDKAENVIQRLQEHDKELHDHLLTCDISDNCKYIQKMNNINDTAFKYDAAKNLIKHMQVTLKKKSKELEQKSSDIAYLQKQLIEHKSKDCDCRKNVVVDSDGIIEENRRLWDGYFHLQLEHISIEKDIEITENKYQLTRDRLNEVSAEKRRLSEENDIQQKEIKEHLKVIECLKGKHKQLEEKLKQFDDRFGKLHCDKEQTDAELSHLKYFIDQQQSALKENELKYISLENEYLHAQELLEEFKRSFEKVEELLDAKTIEYEERSSSLMDELNKEKDKSEVLFNILGSRFVHRVVDAYIKMKELEECIENMINLRNYQMTDDAKTNNNYIENNNVIFENGNEKLQDDKSILHKELKYKIKDLRSKCGESIEKVVQKTNNKLGKYKMALFGKDNNFEIEEFMPSTYEIIKNQLGSVIT
ncbi:hypothetical protein Trydic_g3380 [Trypoxylus dichotomus]